jgi:thiamine-phosphate pyrophosphorylase
VTILLPRLYPIIDADRLTPGLSAAEMARELAAGGATLLQYRSKRLAAPFLLEQVLAIKAAVPNVTLILNDRADLALAAGAHGVHLGQNDLSPAGARLLCPSPMLVGYSTHDPEQVKEGNLMPVEYLAIGPVFATGSKEDADPVVGLTGVHAARMLTRKPLVAIGGITRANCREVLAAGADAVAVISDLVADPRRATAEFMQLLG